MHQDSGTGYQKKFSIRSELKIEDLGAISEMEAAAKYVVKHLTRKIQMLGLTTSFTVLMHKTIGIYRFG